MRARRTCHIEDRRGDRPPRIYRERSAPADGGRLGSPRVAWPDARTGHPRLRRGSLGGGAKLGGGERHSVDCGAAKSRRHDSPSGNTLQRVARTAEPPALRFEGLHAAQASSATRFQSDRTTGRHSDTGHTGFAELGSRPDGGRVREACRRRPDSDLQAETGVWGAAPRGFRGCPETPSVAPSSRKGSDGGGVCAFGSDGQRRAPAEEARAGRLKQFEQRNQAGRAGRMVTPSRANRRRFSTRSSRPDRMVTGLMESPSL
jgi:hypothetical protein